MIDYNNNNFSLQLLNEYNEGYSIKYLSKKYYCSTKFIKNKLLTINYKARSASERSQWKKDRKFRPMKMENNNRWKGGINIFGNRNYIRINSKLYRLAHYNWYINNNLLCLPKGMIIHHKNLNSLDDKIENLILLDTKTHLKFHCYLQENLIGKNKRGI